jgi:hypothetical protein
MLRQSLKKCELNLLLNNLKVFSFNMCVQIDYKSPDNASNYKEHLELLALSRTKIPSYFFTITARLRLFNKLKGIPLFFIGLSEKNLNIFLKNKKNFNIIFFSFYDSALRFLNIYSSSIAFNLNNTLNPSLVFFVVIKFIILHLFFYISLLLKFSILLLYNK